MASTVSPNMNLIVPTVGSELGPQYAFDINNSLALIDQHDHSSGRGVQITPAGLNINSNLSIGSSFLTSVAGVTFTPQTSTPVDATTYVVGEDLYYVDGVGNVIRITQSGAVAGPPGSISNLVTPASATYVPISNTFVFQSGANIAANLDAGSINLRNLSPNSTYALTLSPPVLSANYQITLPYLPSSAGVVTLNTSGIMSSVPLDNSTIGISGGVIEVLPQGITATQIANATITSAQIAASTILASNIASPGLSINPNTITFSGAGTYSWTVPAGVYRVIVTAVGGGGGGASGAYSGNQGGNTSFNGIVVANGAPGGGAPSGLDPGIPGYGTQGPQAMCDFYAGGMQMQTASTLVWANYLFLNPPSNYGQSSPGFSGGINVGGGASTFAAGGAGGPSSGVAGTLGSGGGATEYAGSAFGAGGSGCKAQISIQSVTPAAVIPIVIGAGGASGGGYAGNGGDGMLVIYY